MAYLDHAATSYPKPPEVARAVATVLEAPYGNPGRGGHPLALSAARLIFEAREAIAQLLGVSRSEQLIFTAGATDSLNLAIWGTLWPSRGGSVVLSAWEHNAVYRPLVRWARMAGGTLHVIPPASNGPLDLRAWKRHIGPDTRLAVLTWVSNVTGDVLPIYEAGEYCRTRGVPVLIDAAQAAGHVPEPWEGLPADMVAASGHKGLLGPSGIGLLYLKGPRVPDPLRLGGTGGQSEQPDPPADLPDRYEAGTPNVPGIAGLGEAARWLLGRDRQQRWTREVALRTRLYEGLVRLPDVRVHGPAVTGGIVSFTIEGLSPQDVERHLVERNVYGRAGLHCAPLAHRTLGTLPDGTMRLSIGETTTDDDVATALEAVREVISLIRPVPRRAP
jgi:cysteine desulfurase/selenocysteine lyase